MPVNLVGRCILFSTNEGDVVLDPFCGSGTTAEACYKHNREFIGIEREQEYVKMARTRLERVQAQPIMQLSVVCG